MKRHLVACANLFALVAGMSPHPNHPPSGWEDFTIVAYVENGADDRPLALAGWEDFTIEEHDADFIAPAGWEDFTLPDFTSNLIDESSNESGQCSLPSEEALNDPDFSYDGLCSSKVDGTSPPAGWQEFMFTRRNSASEDEDTSASAGDESSPSQSSIESESPSATVAEDLEEFESTNESEKVDEQKLLERVVRIAEAAPYIQDNITQDYSANSTDIDDGRDGINSMGYFVEYKENEAPIVSFYKNVALPLLLQVRNKIQAIDTEYLAEWRESVQEIISAISSSVMSEVFKTDESGIREEPSSLKMVVAAIRIAFTLISKLSNDTLVFLSKQDSRTLLLLSIATTLLLCSWMISYHHRRRSYRYLRKQKSFAERQTPVLRRKDIPRHTRHWYEKVDGLRGMQAV